MIDVEKWDVERWVRAKPGHGALTVSDVREAIALALEDAAEELRAEYGYYTAANRVSALAARYRQGGGKDGGDPDAE